MRADGLESANSNDRGIPRFTWWPRKGGAEWVQYDFNALRKVSNIAVCWFDDNGAGNCRVPQSARLPHESGGDWKPVAGAGDFGVKKDTLNCVKFPAVETAVLRLEVQLQPGCSGGILEWKIAE